MAGVFMAAILSRLAIARQTFALGGACGVVSAEERITGRRTREQRDGHGEEQSVQPARRRL